MTLMAGMDLPVRAIREQISSAIHIICHLDRMRDGSRRIVQVAEVQGMEGDIITMTDLFVFEQTGFERAGLWAGCAPRGCGRNTWTGLGTAGIHLPPAVFGIGERARY